MVRPMLAKNWDESIDPTGWWMSEKLDGIRAIWNPKIKTFMSRNEKPFIAPLEFIKDFPDTMLDGELWGGRGNFRATSGQVRRKTNQDWSDIIYMVFEIPNGCGFFVEHLLELLRLKLPCNIKIIEQTKCERIEHLLEFLGGVEAKGGEGIMLRHPSSYYEEGKRSSNLLKVKTFKDDEAIVTGYTDGTGKYLGMVGALVCDYKGTQILVGTGLTDHDRNNPPKVGTKITFKYFEMIDNVPRFPVFVGIRNYE